MCRFDVSVCVDLICVSVCVDLMSVCVDLMCVSVCIDLMLSDSEAPQLAAIEDSDDEEDDDWEPEAAAGMSRCRLSDRHE